MGLGVECQLLFHKYKLKLFSSPIRQALNANYCSTNTSGNGISSPGISGTIGRYKETQSVLFVGPAFAARSEFSKFLLVTSLALGPLFYTDNMTMDGVKIDADKTTFGMNAGLAGEYKLNGKTGIGLKLSYTLGYIESLNVEGQNYKSDEKMSISNLMITAFVSFRSW